MLNYQLTDDDRAYWKAEPPLGPPLPFLGISDRDAPDLDP